LVTGPLSLVSALRAVRRDTLTVVKTSSTVEARAAPN
jgi:hypothetical protein